ncbi:sulfotransferase domain-containing protein [Rhodohalobacter sp. 614A]|uniref:sulfotransferase domain-containing protein n=1 Tax=Rhodohalobacter sp. 614A TaxID=2908649 RepID=UPI001F2EE65B|nr:sulfotransferase domain-containing protein [Rhodohalobacter sp. 614A]
MKAFLVPANLDVVVTSYGGAGTTFFMEFLSQFRTINHLHDTGNLKHTAYPPVSIKPSQKFIYLFGDPIHATISLFNRNFHHLHSIKIQQGSNINSPIPESMTLEEYATEGVDRFGFCNHFYNWYRSTSLNPILFIRYETLYENLPAIFDFLELPQSALEMFPERKVRNSVEKEISSETLRQLENMYGKFQNELSKIPDIEIRKGKETNILKRFLHFSRFYVIYGIFKSRRKMKRLYEEKIKK